MGLVGRKGKLSISDSPTDIREIAWQRYEDVLTADVFGAYRYLPPNLGVVPLLGHAVDETGQSLVEYLDRFGVQLLDLDVARIRFWPTMQDSCVPDVFVLLESSITNKSVALLVEAKYHARQHERDGRSQLGHYLIQHISGAYAEGSLAWNLPPNPRPLLFITKHSEIPFAELAQARREVVDALDALVADQIGVFWVNWAKAGQEARRLWRHHREMVDSAPWLRHLLDLYHEIRDRDLLPRPPFIGIPTPHFTQTSPPYQRVYVPATGSAASLREVNQHCHVSAPFAAVSLDTCQFKRTYQPRPIALDRVQPGYTTDRASQHE